MEQDKQTGPRTLRRITRIAPLQAGKMLGAVHACMGLLFLPLFLVLPAAALFAPQNTHTQAATGATAAAVSTMMFGFGIIMPIIYGVMGFVFGVVMAAAYNLFARWLGGFEVEVE